MNVRFWSMLKTVFWTIFNSNVFKTGLTLYITYTVGSSLGMNTKVLVAFSIILYIIPYILLSGIAGQVSDKYQKRTVMVWLKRAEVALMIVTCIGFYFRSVPILLVSLFLEGMIATFLSPISHSIIPDLVEREYLKKAYSRLEVIYHMAIILGGFIGGQIIYLNLAPAGKSFTFTSCLMINALLLSVAAIGLYSTRKFPEARINDPNIVIQWQFSISYAMRDKAIFRAVVSNSWYWVIYGVLFIILPIFVKQNLYAHASVFNLMYALISVGVMIGAFTIGNICKAGNQQEKLIKISGHCISVALIILTLVGYSIERPPERIGIVEFLSHGAHWGLLVALLSFAIAGGLYHVLLVVEILRGETSILSRIVGGWGEFSAGIFLVICFLVLFLLGYGVGPVGILALLTVMTLVINYKWSY